MRRFIVHAVFAFSLSLAVHAEQWPSFRGPAGNGISHEKNLPLQWGANQNVVWRTPLPGPGNSTPVVWGNRIFVSQAVEADNRRTLICFDRHNGSMLWQKGVTQSLKEPSIQDNPPCSPSPVVDGKRIVAWFGSAGIVCYDFKGNELWRCDLGQPSHEWGYASSPVFYHDLCLLNFGPGKNSSLLALEKNTGRIAWRFELPRIPSDAKWKDYGGDATVDAKPEAAKISDIAASWATPLLIRASTGREEVVVAEPLRLLALAPRNGKLLWSCSGPSIGAYSSAFFGDGIVGLAGSGLHNVALAVRPGGDRDVTGTHRLWLQPMSDGKGSIGSGVIFQGHMFLVSVGGFAHCLDLKTGKTIWEERLTGTGARNGCWSSLLLAGDRLYVPNKNADVFVLRASAKFECLATNSIGGEPMNASLAASDGAIFLRTDKALWCISHN